MTKNHLIMKKVVLAAMLLIGFTAMAQPSSSRERGARNGMQDLTPEQMATLQTKKMTLALDLSDGQQEQIKAIELKNAKMRKAKMEERKAQKEAGDSKKPTSEERYAMSNARLDSQIAQMAEMKKILSETQYEKWEKMQQHKGRHGKGKRGKGHGHKGKKKQK